MSLRLLTLNIEGDRHLDRIAAVIARHKPDIACLQEVFENDLSSLTAEGRYQAKFAATALVVDPVSGTARKWGVAALTRLPVNTQDVNYYTEMRGFASCVSRMISAACCSPLNSIIKGARSAL